MNIGKWLVKNTESLNGKTVAVTGSTGGLGVELCGYLAAMGASIILVDRNEARSKEHRQKLIDRYGVSVRCLTLDLEDVSSADRIVNELCSMDVSVFIHNAGAYSIPRHKCSTGYDNVYQINFVTPYYIIRRILPVLKRQKGKVVVVGSIAHNYSRIDAHDIDFSTRNESSKVYGNAKRYLMYSLHDLFKDEEDVSLSVTHPGITFTNITAHYPPLIFALIKHPMKVIFMKPKKAALSILSGVFNKTEYGTWIGPSLFNVWGMPKKKKINTATAEEIKQISQIAESVYERCVKSITT